MSDAKIERKIAVIFATDVVGYSKHMEVDENETIHSLRACEEILQKHFSYSVLGKKLMEMVNHAG